MTKDHVTLASPTIWKQLQGSYVIIGSKLNQCNVKKTQSLVSKYCKLSLIKTNITTPIQKWILVNKYIVHKSPNHSNGEVCMNSWLHYLKKHQGQNLLKQ